MVGIRTEMCYYGFMDGREFVRRARRYARRNKLDFSFDPIKGKGSHSEVEIGGRRTIVKKGEIRRGLLAAMLKQLEIDPREF